MTVVWFLLGGLATVVAVLAVGSARLAARHDAAVTAAYTDDLTGLRNRRAFVAALPRLVERAEVAAAPLTLVMLELTGLSSINEELGRRHGDVLVGRAGRALAGHQPGVRAYRLGGDAFAVVLDAGRADATDLAEDLCDRVERLAWPLGAVAGLCALDDRTPDVETLLVGADAALSSARDRAIAVTAWTETTGLDLPPAEPELELPDPWDPRWLAND